MKNKCAWCNIEIGSPKGISWNDNEENEISHGICDNCTDNLLFQSGVDLQSYIDSLNIPVVTVNTDGIIDITNLTASKYFKKEKSKIEGYKGGDVFECAHSRLPEGCGNTVHCNGCTIRNTVMKTHKTGKSYFKIPAIQKRYKDAGGTEEIRYLITTFKYRNYVLLKIEDVEK